MTGSAPATTAQQCEHEILPSALGERGEILPDNHELITMRFFLFILANALLFIRPSEFMPDLAAVEIYRWFILAVPGGVAAGRLLQQLSLRFPGVPPIVSLRRPAFARRFSCRAFFTATSS